MNKTINGVMLGFALALASSNAAFADLKVTFDEGAPKDRFTFTNNGKCSLKEASVTLDLSGSKSGLIFDVTSKGAGVEVFQPLELTSGRSVLTSVPSVKDGDNKIIFPVAELPSNKSFSFTIDVDDTMGEREITVSDSEIAGALVSVVKGTTQSKGVFSNSARTTASLNECS